MVSTVRQMAPLPLVVLMFCPSIAGLSTEGTTTGAEAQRLKIAWQVLTLHWALELTCIKHGISASAARRGRVRDALDASRRGGARGSDPMRSCSTNLENSVAVSIHHAIDVVVDTGRVGACFRRREQV